MPSYRLIPEHWDSDEPWLLEWDELLLCLTRPDGQVALQSRVDASYRIFDTRHLLVAGKITLRISDHGYPCTITFTKHKSAAQDVLGLVKLGLSSDPQFRRQQKRYAAFELLFGIGLSLINPILVWLYISWAESAPNPRPGQWLYYLLGLLGGWLTGVLACFALVGPLAVFWGFKQLRHVWVCNKTVRRDSGVANG